MTTEFINKGESDHRPLIVGFGGTSQPGSSAERVLQVALAASEAAGARVRMFDGAYLANLPHYLSADPMTIPQAAEFVGAVRAASGVIIASPGYHGSISGLVKNAIDYLEGTARDPERTYLDGLPVGLIVTAYGWQATGTTLAALRSIVHALRGWPTPYGAGINSAGGLFDGDRLKDEGVQGQLTTIGRQVLHFHRLATARADALPSR